MVCWVYENPCQWLFRSVMVRGESDHKLTCTWIFSITQQKNRSEQSLLVGIIPKRDVIVQRGEVEEDERSGSGTRDARRPNPGEGREKP